MSTESEIINYEERLRSAQLKSDIEELSILLDDGLIFSVFDGSVIGKNEDLNLHRSADFHITKMDVIDRSIQCYENAAVVNVLMNASAETGGVAQSNLIRYVRVWYRFGGSWRVISGSMRIQ